MFALLALTLLSAAPDAGTATIELVNAGAPSTFDLRAVEAVGLTDAKWTDHGQSHKVRGVPLESLLLKAGFDKGVMGKDVKPKDKRAGWKRAVRVSASDGFQAVFSAAELFPDMGSTRALLVTQLDGKPVGSETGPFRLVVLTDKEGSRSVRNVTRIELLDLTSDSK